MKELAAAKNIANPKELDEALDDMGKRFPDPVKKWIKTVARNYLVRELDTMFHEVTFKDKNRWQELTGEPLPDWAKKALFSGKVLHLFIPDATFSRFKDNVEHATVYLQTLTTDLSRVPYETAVKEGNKLMRQGIKKQHLETIPDQGKAETIFRCTEGFSWINLPAEALEAESNYMGHCVGQKRWGYYDAVLEKRMEIWSLRDPGGHPHVTIQYTPQGKRIDQIKGKENKGVVERYAKYLIQLLNSDYFRSRVNAVARGELELNNVGTSSSGEYFSYFDPPDDLTTDQYKPEMSEIRGIPKLPRKLQARSVGIKQITISEGTQTTTSDALLGRKLVVESAWVLRNGAANLDEVALKPMGRIVLDVNNAIVSEIKSAIGMMIQGMQFTRADKIEIHNAGISGKARELSTYEISGHEGGNNIVFDVEVQYLHLEHLRDCSGTIKYQEMRPAFDVSRIERANPNLKLVQTR